ncbi:spike base protein, RCAP_Rcc01079 family [Falsirhodobacter halotolerans]|uniref:spike base protein, RCAP_Rcc01079 family n=1 Tax=Falsirhodobacter halotolerans TaxID=1146892 RepID=UPI001FD1EF89|nr:hypothetical protein [Falsirhodobacter halotolerans]MCJ8139411.1 hypothetical protein [Falsirhodobacter halotolerans]
MPSRFAKFHKGVTAPAVGAVAVTPSDTQDLTEEIRGVTLGVGGTLRYLGGDGMTYTTGDLPAGTYPLFAQRILASGTTAQKITGWI